MHLASPNQVMQRFELQRGFALDVAKKDLRLAGAVVEVDVETGRAVHLERLLIPVQ